MTGPSVDRLAGQLGYLFEEQPELRAASVDQLVERLNREDRYARARQRYPMATDGEIAQRVAEFDERITAADVRAALERVRADRFED